MFGSRSLAVHLLRGLAGFGALAAALLLLPSHGGWALALLLVALLALRGCPSCWMIGLFETLSGRSTAKRCLDGSCAKSSFDSP